MLIKTLFLFSFSGEPGDQTGSPGFPGAKGERGDAGYPGEFPECHNLKFYQLDQLLSTIHYYQQLSTTKKKLDVFFPKCCSSI